MTNDIKNKLWTNGINRGSLLLNGGSERLKLEEQWCPQVLEGSPTRKLCLETGQHMEQEQLPATTKLWGWSQPGRAWSRDKGVLQPHKMDPEPEPALPHVTTTA